jgi:hypothetical protein
MRGPASKETHRRNVEGRSHLAEGEAETQGHFAVDTGGLARSMVDALEDILKWERASERARTSSPN